MDRKVSLINLSKLSQFEYVVENGFWLTLSSEKLPLKQKKTPENNKLSCISINRKILNRFIERLDLLIWILWLLYSKTIKHTAYLEKPQYLKLDNSEVRKKS